MCGKNKPQAGGVSLLFLFLAAGAAANPVAAMTVFLDPSIPPPSPVGTIVTWNAGVPDASQGTLWYRFRARGAGTDFRMIRDYGPISSLDWTASDHEGDYEVEVSVRNIDTGEFAATSSVYTMTSRVLDSAPVISPTANPLVFLYSAPPCAAGNWMKVTFGSQDAEVSTPYKPCEEGLSMNFYLAGMRSGSTYSVWHTIGVGAGSTVGPVLTLMTPGVSLQSPGYSVLQPLALPSSRDGILLQATLFQNTVATDLQGNVVWFYPGNIEFLTRPQGHGLFFGIVQAFGSDPSNQVLREFNLAGTTIRETNAARVSEQLTAMGMRPINAFHHEARGLPGGNILVLANTEQILTDVQGPGPVDVIGDTILVLDSGLQVLWAWDAFDHLDPSRMATLREVCIGASSGCPPYYKAQQANDWLHGNSVQLTPDGNLLYSSRHQDWLIKIDYRNGQGNGDILWRLGKDGDFQTDSTDPNPWFSHQHDAQFEMGNSSTLTLFDDSNVRHSTDPNANSRGQVIQLDEQNRVAHFILNADLGGYCFALGSAQKLPDGNYHFDLGWLPDGTSQSVEIDPAGNRVYAIQIGVADYRSFRMQDLYTSIDAMSGDMRAPDVKESAPAQAIGFLIRISWPPERSPSESFSRRRRPQWYRGLPSQSRTGRVSVLIIVPPRKPQTSCWFTRTISVTETSDAMDRAFLRRTSTAWRRKAYASPSLIRPARSVRRRAPRC